MRIRHVIRGRLNPDNADGIITHTYRLAHAQLQLGHDVEVYGVASKAREPEVIDREGLVVRAFPWSAIPGRVDPSLREVIATDAAQPTTMFHLQPPHDPAVAALGRLLRKSDLPYFVSPHAMWSPHALSRAGLKKRVYKLLVDDRLVAGAIGVHATAAAEIPEIHEYAPKSRVFAIRNSIDWKEIESMERAPAFWQDRYGVRSDVRVVAFLGRLDPYQKGLDILLEAWDEATAGSETPAVLALIGTPWRETYDDLTAAIAGLGSPESVMLTGPLFGIEKYQALAAADVYAQTSRYETSPYSIQEALATGLPAIVSPGTNFALPVSAYDAGFSVELTRGSIADALRAAFDAPPARLQAMGENARRLVRERHSLDRAAKRMVEAYEAAMSGASFEDDD